MARDWKCARCGTGNAETAVSCQGCGMIRGGVVAFTAYVGVAYESSKLEIVWFSPIQDGWNQGDRGIQRTVYDPNDSQLTASLKGANR
jgi:hypothetical protein